MNQVKRLFVAIKIRPTRELKEVYKSIRQGLSDGEIKWVNEKNLHITLKFLGDTPGQQIPDITSALQKVAQKHQPFSFQIRSFGNFGSQRVPRVLWLGVEEQGNSLENLFYDVQNAMVDAGFDKENLVFKPHLTVGRIKQLNIIDKLHELENRYSGKNIQDVYVESFELYESIFVSRSVVYKEIERFSLLP